ncbi:hypothetical protein LCGC14_1854110 [marine sediment metagenome]|uniref:Uncharacterized protein n=1 Tax=marine sediment metagenome TaxID=412755 RepID=A0A0F9GXR6_9ZZZZ
MALRVTRQYNEALAAGVGELRVTRQYIEVLGTGVGKLRVSRQYIEVLGEFLAITEYLRDVDHDLNLTQNVSPSVDIVRALSNTLNLSQEAHTSQTFHEVLTSNITWSSIVSQVKDGIATSTLNLTQDVIDLLIQQERMVVESTMNLVQEVDWWTGGYHYIVHDLGLTETAAWIGPRPAAATHFLPLNSMVIGVRGAPWAPVLVGHELNLSSGVGISYLLGVNSVITMTHDMYRGEVSESTMNIVQSLESGILKGLQPTEISFVQSIDRIAIFTRAVEHSSVVGHALTYYIATACNYKQYTPFIGENTISNRPAPPAESEPFITHDPTASRFKLTYPAASAPSDEVELRAPELDNIERIAFNRINRETRGGKLTVFADPNWPKTQTIVATFIGLTQTEIDNLLDFFVAHVGAEIGMQDWEGREWIGVITTPNETAVQDGASCTGRGWTITFEFEGVLVENYARGDKLDLADVIEIYNMVRDFISGGADGVIDATDAIILMNKLKNLVKDNQTTE